MKKILQSCNGLLLLECGHYLRDHKEYYVFNPTTKQSRNLRLSSTAFSELSLIFDPSKSHHYRVVCFRSDENSTSFRVYDSETHKWKDGGKSIQGPYKFRDGLFWKGPIYFIRHLGTSFCFLPDDNNNIIHDVPNPPRSPTSGSKKNYLESNGHLHYLRLCSWPAESIPYVYEMIDNKWLTGCSDDHRIPTARFAGRNNTKITEIDLLGMIRGERVEDSMLLYHVHGKIMIYRFVDEVNEVLVDFTSDFFCLENQLQFGFKDAHPFIASFATVCDYFIFGWIGYIIYMQIAL